MLTYLSFDQWKSQNRDITEEACAKCNGEGEIKCPDCDGVGEVKFPEGVEECDTCWGEKMVICWDCEGCGGKVMGLYWNELVMYYRNSPPEEIRA